MDHWCSCEFIQLLKGEQFSEFLGSPQCSTLHICLKAKGGDTNLFGMKNVHKSLAPQFKHNLESSVLSLLPTFF